MKERPKWAYTLPREIFKKFDGNLINSVELSYTITGADSSQSYLTFYYNGQSVIKIEADSPGFWELFEFTKRPYSNLICYTYEGRRAADISEDIDEFEANNAAEYETYLQLKRKFES
jgi:hypothetical protein